MPSPNIYFITGSDEAAVKAAASRLAETLIPNADTLSKEVIDGTVENVDQAVECILSTTQALLTFPFLQESKLVWLKNASIFADSVVGRSEMVTTALEKLQHVLETGLPQNILFLLSAPEADKRRAFYKTLSKLANVTICDKPNFGWNATDADIADWLSKKAVPYGLNFTSEALDLLATRIGADTRQAESEFEKLFSALASQNTNTPIPESLIRELVPATRESGIFDLSNALSSRNINLCLESLQQLLSQGEQAIGILLVAIIPTIRNLLITKGLLEHHRLPTPPHAGAFSHSIARLSNENLSHLPKKKDGTTNTYILGIAAVNCARYSLTELKSALTECLETNRLLISTSLDGETVLTRLLLRIVGKNNDNTRAHF